MTPLLQLVDVTCRFGGLVANADVSFDVPGGGILGLIGPNGAGKSTLFNQIAGLYQPTSGRILFQGQDLAGIPGPARCRLGIARTFQVPRGFQSMSVLENVTVGALVRHRAARAARQAAFDTLHTVGLAARAHVSAAALTPPEKRRLELARALATAPKLLLLDEVMTGLTPVEAQAGADIIRRLAASGITIIMVEHVMEVVMPLVNRCIVLNLGRVLVDAPPEDVVRDERVITAYLGDRHRAA